MRIISQARAAAVLASTLAFAACADQPLTPPSQDPLFQAAVAMGFAPQSIVDRGAYFVAEGDIIIRKSSLRPGRRRYQGRPCLHRSRTINSARRGSSTGRRSRRCGWT